jgi:hypothetical protein
MRTVLAVIGSALLSTLSTAAFAQNPVQTMSPANAATITNWYTEHLADPADPKRGTRVSDPLYGRGRGTSPVVIGVGGLVGFGEKDALPILNSEYTSGPARRAR